MLLEFLHDATDKWCTLPMSQCTVTTADIYFILLRMAVLLCIRQAAKGHSQVVELLTNAGAVVDIQNEVVVCGLYIYLVGV